jgi:hypothetical protein
VKKTVVVLLVLGLAACVSSRAIMAPTQTDVDRMQSKFPGYTLTDLANGKTLYEENCGNCHGLKKFNSETEEDWKKIVPNMVRKANKKGSSIDQKGEDDILRYVITMESRPK